MGLSKLAIELTSLCNLDCEYCFKELGTSHIDIRLLERILREARAWGASKVTYTGGEPLLYPSFEEAFRLAETLGYRYSVVTNGWHFQRVLPILKTTRRALSHIFFSLDSATEALHDSVRGVGSFQKIMSAAETCRVDDLPFAFLTVVNQKNANEMEGLALIAARLGAAGIKFGHLLPTPAKLDNRLSLNDQQRRAAEEEASKLDSSLSIAVSFSAAASNDTPGACCEPLAGRTASIDCHGRLSLCCQLAEYRGAANQNDIAADLNTTDFGNAYAKFLALAAAQRSRRDKALTIGSALAAYPCDFCISSMEKVG